MRKQLFFALFVVHCSLFVGSARADVKYYVGKDGRPPETPSAEAEKIKRIYAYGGYGFHLAEKIDDMHVESGVGSAIGGIGFRFTETVRAELAYESMGGEYDTDGFGVVKSDGSFGFANILFDAKLPSAYRLFKTSPFVPFVGFGAGAGYVEIDGGLKLNRGFAMAYNFIGGVSIEINRTIALAFSYKYIKMLPDDVMSGDVAVLEKFAPYGHNLGVAFRMNF